MQLSDYLRVAQRRWLTVFISTALALALGTGLTALIEQQYRARAELYVSTVSAQTPTDLAQGSTYTQRQVTTYASIATTPYVLTPIIEELGLSMTPEQLAPKIAVRAPSNTSLIQIAVDDPDPDEALKLAAAISEQLVQTLADLDQVDEQATSPVKATIVRPAVVLETPVTPQPLRNALLAGLVGLLVGGALALFRDKRDTSIRTEADVRSLTDLPVLGEITHDKEAAETCRLVIDEPHHPRSEAFRTLRTNLQYVNPDTPIRSMVVTSSVPEEGKTTTVAQLALTLAATGQSVCLVEGDLRRPQLAAYLGMEGSAGLTSALIGNAALDDMLQKYADTSLTLLGSGALPPNPAELLGSTRMRALMEELKSRFDVVILDAPPLLPATDAAILATISDGAILVVGAGVARKEHVGRALMRLEQARANTVGLIVNRLPASRSAGQYYGYSGHTGPDANTAGPASDKSTDPWRPHRPGRESPTHRDGQSTSTT